MQKKDKKNEFFFQEQDIFIDFQKKIYKKDKLFFEFLVKKIVSEGEKKVSVSLKNLLQLLDFKTKEEFEKFFNKFFEKRIIYKCEKLNILHNEGSIYPVSSYKFSNSNYIFNISNDFFEIFQKSNSEFKSYHFDVLLQFNNPITKKLFLFLINNIGINNFFEVSLPTLKKYLELDDSYLRFYDFEKNILTNCIDEIQNYTSLKVKYEKIKLHDSSSSKIIGLKFHLLDETKNGLDTNTDLLLQDVLPLIKNIHKVWNFIFHTLSAKGFSYMKKNIDYAHLHYKGNFEIFLIESVKYDYFNTRFSKAILPFEEKYKVIYSLKKTFINLPQLYNELFEIISGMNLFYLTQMAPIFKEAYKLMESGYINQKEQPQIAPFYEELYNLKKINEFKYEDEKFAIFIEYNGKYNSFIYIVEK